MDDLLQTAKSALQSRKYEKEIVLQEKREKEFEYFKCLMSEIEDKTLRLGYHWDSRESRYFGLVPQYFKPQIADYFRNKGFNVLYIPWLWFTIKIPR